VERIGSKLKLLYVKKKNVDILIQQQILYATMYAYLMISNPINY